LFEGLYSVIDQAASREFLQSSAARKQNPEECLGLLAVHEHVLEVCRVRDPFGGGFWVCAGQRNDEFPKREKRATCVVQ
jgi:hypothetical protein